MEPTDGVVSMISEVVYGLGDKAVYRDEDSFYVSQSLMQTLYTSKLTKTEFEVVFHTLAIGILLSPAELAQELEVTPKTVKKAIASLQRLGILDQILDAGQLPRPTDDQTP